MNMKINLAKLLLGVFFIPLFSACEQDYSILGIARTESAQPPSGVPIAPQTPHPTSAPNPTPIDPSTILSISETFDAMTRASSTAIFYSPVDLLWVVDNSGSMSDNQNKLASEFANFAQTYMTANRDIRTGVITTDAFWAGGVEPMQGFSYGPNFGADYARLLPGFADGPRPFTPTNTTAPRSGNPILSSLVPNNQTPASWLQQIVSAFSLNAKPGTDGDGSERGMESVVKFLEDNEKQACPTHYPHCHLFRKNSTRGIIFVTDENDSSFFSECQTSDLVKKYNGTPDGSYGDYTTKYFQNGYMHLVSTGTSTGSSANDSVTACNITVGKKMIDNFFIWLDNGSTKRNYFIAAIVHPLQGLPATVPATGFPGCDPEMCKTSKTYAELVKLMKSDAQNPAASSSSTFDILKNNYSSLLTSIGQSTQTNSSNIPTGSFTLKQSPLNSSSIVIVIFDPSASYSKTLTPTDFTLDGNIIQIKNSAFEGVPTTAKVKITYQATSS